MHDFAEQQMIAQAQSGDQAAREAIIMECLAYVRSVAITLSLSYRVEYEELVGMGNLILVEQFTTALTKDNAYAYLKGCVKWNLLHACQKWRFLYALADDFAAPAEMQTPERDYTFLYEAINNLPQTERQAVVLYYGLFGSPRESLYKLSLSVSPNPKGTVMYLRLKRALARLRRILVRTSVCRDIEAA